MWGWLRAWRAAEVKRRDWELYIGLLVGLLCEKQSCFRDSDSWVYRAEEPKDGLSRTTEKTGEG